MGIAVLGLVGCGDATYEGESAHAGYDVGTKSEQVTRTCGVDKYAGPQGADVSKWQGNFDWPSAGVVFGYARISDGVNYVDSTFDQNWANMKAAGILRGAYQYFEPAQSASAQADMMVAKVGMLGAGDMPCMIDVEATGGQTPATIAQKVQTWLDIVERGTGKRPVIYTGAYFWQDYVQSTAFGGYPLWIAAYGPSCPSIPDGWTNWTFWQYCDGQTQYCTNGKGFDRDVFNGTMAELEAFAGGTVAEYYGAGFVEQSFPLASTALTMAAGETLPAYITLKNTGTKSWDSNTRLGTTEPRDRASEFSDASWLGPNRPAGVSGTVAPGETFKFSFNLHAPATPGTYFEHFGVLEEGVTWFGDSGQGGPPDSQLEAQIQVVASGGSGGGGTGSGGTGGGGSSGGSGGSGAMAGGSGWPDSGAAAGTGAGTGTNQASRTVTDSDDSGCACRAASPMRHSGSRTPLALLLVAGLFARRRRPTK